MARNWVSIVSHMVFGVSVALAYKGLETYRQRQRAPETPAA
jgi:hypothetical protein